MADSLILMVLALVVFGPRRLPQIGRQIGKLMYEFRKASNDFKFQMEEELRLSEEADRKKKEEVERLQRMAALPAPAATVEAPVEPAATEQASVSAEASPYPGENTYPPVDTAEPAPAVAAQEQAVTLPRTVPVIHPPSTGEMVQASRPGGFAGGAARQSEADGTGLPDGGEEAKVSEEPSPTIIPTEEATRTETVSQHG